MSDPLRPGAVVWVRFDPTQGRERAGTRPALVVCRAEYLEAVPELVIVVPVTTRDRGWPHHVRLAGDFRLRRASYAMTEQPRTISRDRIVRTAGQVDAATLAAVRRWLDDFLC